MSLVTQAAVHAALKAWWDDTLALTAAVPGGLWEGRPGEDAAMPYAVAALAPGDVTYTSGPAIQRFALTITAYSHAGRTDAGGIEKALRKEICHRHRGRLRVAGAVGTVQLLEGAFEARTEPDTNDGLNVLATVGKWDLLVEANP